MEKWGDRENWENLERRTYIPEEMYQVSGNVLCNVSYLPH